MSHVDYTAALSVACPRCKVAPGEGCRTALMPNTPETNNFHAERTTSAARVTRDANRAAKADA